MLPPKNKQIILENTVCNNTGDGAIMLAAIKILNCVFKNKIDITVFDQHPETPRKIYPDQNIHRLISDKLFLTRLGGTKLKRLKSRIYNLKSWAILWLAKHNVWLLVNWLLPKELAQDVKIYAKADMIMTTGGTYLVEHYNFSQRVQQFKIDQFFGKPLIFFTQSLGPYKEQSINALRNIMIKSPLILLRDEKSLRNLDPMLTDKSHCHVVADSVFALAEIERIENILNEATLKSPKIKNIAISVRQWPHFKKRTVEDGMRLYKKAIADLAVKLVKEYGATITFISTCQGLPDYHYDDSKVASEIFETLPTDIQQHVSVNSEYHGPKEIMNILRTMDLVVATRMHMMIMALCVGTPVLPISYEFKTTELSNDMKLSDILSDIEDITSDDLIAKADLLLNNYPDYLQLQMQGVKDQYNSAMSAVELIQAALNISQEETSSIAS